MPSQKNIILGILGLHLASYLPVSVAVLTPVDAACTPEATLCLNFSRALASPKTEALLSADAAL